MSGRLRVTAPYVTAQTAVDGGRAEVDIPRGAVLPDDVPDEQRERFLRLGQVEPVEPVDELVDDADDEEVPVGTIDEVLAWVGDSPDRAGRALDAEQAKVDGARSTLVARLNAILDQ